jgi:molybdate transport system substrate-binding protein
MILGIDASVTKLSAAKIIDARTLTPLGTTGIGIAVLPGDKIPDVSTVEALTNVLTAARSVAYSRNSPSGIYFAKLLQDLSIAEQVNEHATVVELGFTATALLDGRPDLAVQQMSELIFFPEARIAGPLPADVQHYTAFSAGIALESKNNAGSSSLLRFLSTKLARDAYSDAGLEPG